MSRTIGILTLLWAVHGSATEASVADPGNVFAAFTTYIGRQVQSDKEKFARADGCTQWFYQQQRKKPAKPPAMGVSLPSRQSSPLTHSQAWGLPASRGPAPTSECQTRYPGGLDAAREDFSRTQSSLALSLTFYEFALVGDGNDDGTYSSAEIKDILESFGLSFHAGEAPATHLTLLNAQFDAVRKAGGLEVLMGSMGVLYERGYRFTTPDRAAMDRVAG
jgi:hypothetical protein